MEVGSLVKLDPELYVRERDHTGVLIEKAPPRGHGVQWIVMIKGRVHPYYIDEKDMELTNENG